MSAEFAHITMADFITGEAECPITGELCPAREKLISMYRDSHTGEAEASAMLFDETHPYYDEQKLQVKLFEQAVFARAINCSGPEATTCPTRTRMNDSKVRTGLVGMFRRARKAVN